MAGSNNNKGGPALVTPAEDLRRRMKRGFQCNDVRGAAVVVDGSGNASSSVRVVEGARRRRESS